MMRTRCYLINLLIFLTSTLSSPSIRKGSHKLLLLFKQRRRVTETQDNTSWTWMLKILPRRFKILSIRNKWVSGTKSDFRWNRMTSTTFNTPKCLFPQNFKHAHDQGVNFRLRFDILGEVRYFQRSQFLSLNEEYGLIIKRKVK